MADITIQNIVASTTIADFLDLDKITQSVPNTSYRPTIFPGLVLRIQQPKTAFLLFKSGKVVCTGAKNIEDIKKSMKQMCAMLQKVGFKVTDEYRDPSFMKAFSAPGITRLTMSF